MAAPGKPSAPTTTSRWGSFLSSAVTSVESRLDNILAEGGTASQGNAASPPSDANPAVKKDRVQAVKTAAAVAANTKSNAAARQTANDRLQARLAKAMAGKQSPGGPSPRASIDASRNSSDRPSIDSTTEKEAATPESAEPDSQKAEGTKEEDATQSEPSENAKAGTPSAAEASTSDKSELTTNSAAVETNESEKKASTNRSSDHEITTSNPPEPSRAADVPAIMVPPADVVLLLQDMEDIKKRQEEEISEYVERIDSLQAKLQYLSKSAADTAKKTAQGAASGSVEKKLAEKDEKIALLMEEGQKLSSNEQKFRTTLKKLRLQIAEHDKQTEELKKSKDKAEADMAILRSQVNGEADQEKRQEETRKATAALQKEIETLKKDKASRDDTIKKMEQEAKKKAEQVAASNAQALAKALASERDKQKELEDAVSTLQGEKDAAADKARLEVIEWREKLERATDRQRTTESELKHELAAAEGKLEAMRTSAEEAASGPAGDAQLKLLRQIETLQSQYASASDNWQGIEASLLAKVSNLQKERDEAQRRESEMRKKAREASSKSRQLEEELQDIQPAHTQARQELEICREQLASLRASSKSTETALEQARTDLEKQQRAASSRDFSAESNQQQWTEDVAAQAAQHPGLRRVDSRPDSPLLSVTRTFSSDIMSPGGGFPLPGRSRRMPTPNGGSIPDSPAEGLGLSLGRRQPSQPPVQRTTTFSLTGSSMPPPTPFDPPAAESASGMHSPPMREPEGSIAETNPTRDRDMAQDMISVSTVAAGPSVQLVEHMSATIRQLKADKVAAKEEMARVCNQRDEARSDMVLLMKQVEEAKAAGDKVQELETELGSINQRYQTTLEMLGEKSELVEELKADVDDVKAMYRELVERTIK